MREIILTSAQAASATLIQKAVDSLGDSGGRVVLYAENGIAIAWLWLQPQLHAGVRGQTHRQPA